MVLITTAAWKKGEVRIHGAGDMWCREAADSEKRCRSDHGTMVLSVSHQSEGLEVILKDG